jgi:diguanylate cyclase
MTPEQKASIDYINQTLASVETPKVLVVDDNPRDVELHLHMLSQFKCNVVVAKSGEEAAREIRDDGIDLILLDQKLPQMSSADIVELATGLLPEASVIIVSGYPDSVTKSAAVKKGVKLILSKPLTEETLSAILHRKPDLPC